jgi:hypothetical protein
MIFKRNETTKENVRKVDLEFKPIKAGGFAALKYIKTSIGLITLKVFKGAAYTDKPGLYFVELSGKRSKEGIYLSNVNEYELTALFVLIEKI